MISGKRTLETHVIDYHLSHCLVPNVYVIEIVLIPLGDYQHYQHHHPHVKHDRDGQQQHQHQQHLPHRFVSYVDHFADQHGCFSPYCCHV